MQSTDGSQPSTPVGRIRWPAYVKETVIQGDQVEVLPDENGARVIMCRGSFDLDTLAPFAAAAQAAAVDPSVRRIILDMSHVSFADSSLLNLLVVLHRTGRLILAGPLPDRVTQLLQLTGMDAVLTIAEGLPGARALP
ncbi:STAS domain-containing protein [Streptomyces sp. cmx-4-9]|uniref:STAS domain-containing protein n=1 Tax=Streptomyces sp. cmx-4-9 TaxID=2790941 RepID=UPI00398124FD